MKVGGPVILSWSLHDLLNGSEILAILISELMLKRVTQLWLRLRINDDETITVIAAVVELVKGRTQIPASR